MRIVFLYTELAVYFLECVKYLQKKNVEIHIVRWPVNIEAPFDLDFGTKIKIYDRRDYDNKELIKIVESIDPSIIFCSGWIDKGYLNICKFYIRKIPVVLLLDNHWKGKLKQRIAVAISWIAVKKYFSHCWVPGEIQSEYARRLGFLPNKIFTGYYSCDYNYFHNLYVLHRENKKNKFPKRFIYMGRYIKSKGIEDLWTAFVRLQHEYPNEWELWCAGTGPVHALEHPKIKHLGFIQPHEMEACICQTGVFVLPSRFEPWGVAVHEFAAAGYPLVLSTEVGAHTTFLDVNKNGFIFKAQNSDEIYRCLKNIVLMSEIDLVKMGEKSAVLASRITPDKWVETVFRLIQEK